ncbi:hypothetical protein Tco_0261762 [Tanacetum coccineum]
MIRVASPPTHHPLPSPTPSPPLLLPSNARRADIPEANISPRKRLLLAAPKPRFEVGERSDAATRQSGSIMARRVDYSFVDTLDVSIRAFERRIMAAIEMVNLRVSYQANLHRWESEEFYTRHHDAQGDRAALRDEVDTLRRALEALEARARIDTLEDSGSSAYYHVWHAKYYGLFSASMAVGLKIPQKKRTATTTTTTPMTDAQLKALIAQGVADALVERDTYISRNGDDSHDSGSDGRRRMPVARECTYNDFLKCQPLNFKGTEGVVVLTQWFEKMESVFHISNCTVACQIKFSTCTLQGNALTW